jgi:hypothetical protein
MSSSEGFQTKMRLKAKVRKSHKQLLATRRCRRAARPRACLSLPPRLVCCAAVQWRHGAGFRRCINPCILSADSSLHRMLWGGRRGRISKPARTAQASSQTVRSSCLDRRWQWCSPRSLSGLQRFRYWRRNKTGDRRRASSAVHAFVHAHWTTWQALSRRLARRASGRLCFCGPRSRKETILNPALPQRCF